MTGPAKPEAVWRRHTECLVIKSQIVAELELAFSFAPNARLTLIGRDYERSPAQSLPTHEARRVAEAHARDEWGAA